MALKLAEETSGVMGRIASRIGLVVAPLLNTAPPAAALAARR
jgi:hypothetical protein